MLKKMIMLNLLISPMMKHPLSMSTMLIIQTTFLSIEMTKMTKNSWFSYIMFLTIIGGLMIMFIFMSSISSNEKFKLNKKLFMMTIMMLIIIMMMKKNNMFIMKTFSMKMLMQENEELKSTTKFFNSQKMNISIIMIMTLLLTMISVTNISNSFKGPLKKTYV